MEKRIVTLGLCFLCVAAIFAQDSADAVASKARFFATGEKQRVVAKLTVELGAEKKFRDLELFYISSPSSNKLLARIISPAFLREMKVLLVTSEGRSDTWIKTSQGVKRLGLGARGESLFQSDFLTSDFNIPEGGWLFSKNDGEDSCRIIERRGERSDDYFLQRLYLRDTDFLVARRDYIDSAGVVIRSYVVTEWVAVAGLSGRPARIDLIKNKSKGLSYFEIIEIHAEDRLPEGLFSPGSL